MVATLILGIITLSALIISLVKDREKTKKGFGITKKMLLSMGGEIIGILALVGLILAYIPKNTITRLLGGANEGVSILWGALMGTVTIIPGVIAFPLSKELYLQGASLTPIAAFITTLTMVGFATAPLEIRHFGKKFTLLRNLLSLAGALLIALALGVIL